MLALRSPLTRSAAAACPRAPPRARVARVSAFLVTAQGPEGGQKTFQCGPDQTLLAAAEAAGVELPNLCTGGTCGSCAARVLKGQVQVADSTILDEQQTQAGYVVVCSTYPRSDVTLLTHQENEMWLVQQ